MVEIKGTILMLRWGAYEAPVVRQIQRGAGGHVVGARGLLI
jgi:hypothetical protein